MEALKNLINKISHIKICEFNQDGRINSISDETTLIAQLEKFGPLFDLKIKIHEMLDFLDLVRGYKKITGIGLSKHFVHLDCAPGKRRFWIY